jgi:hypothetical protein
MGLKSIISCNPITMEGISDDMAKRQFGDIIDKVNAGNSQVSTWESDWVEVGVGQNFTLNHDLDRVPSIVQLEFSTIGDEVNGSCAFYNDGTHDVGCVVWAKDKDQITIQTAADKVGVSMTTAGVASKEASGWIRVSAW